MKADDDTLSFKAQQLQPPPPTITSMLKKTAATAAEAEKLSRVEPSGLPVRAEAPRVEVTARPAMRAYALGLYRADGGSAPLLQRVDDVYTNGRAPAHEPKVMCGQRIEIVPLREGDVLSAY